MGKDPRLDQFVQLAAASASDPSPPVRATRSVYDDQGRVVKTERLKDVVVTISNPITNPQSEITNPGTLLTTSETIYDEKGRVSRSIAAGGQITDFRYDTQGRQTATAGCAASPAAARASGTDR